LQIELDDSNTFLALLFIVIFNLETIFGLTKPWAKIMGKTTMAHITHLSFVTLRIALVIQHGESFRGKK
jgi:hypothetical protein